MKKKQRTYVSSLPELRFKLAEAWADFEDGNISNARANTVVKFADSMVKAFATETLHNKVNGVIKEIDFLSDPEKRDEQATKLIDEFTRE